MTRTLINSSVIAAVSYASDQNVLEVELNDGGIYQYYDVGPDVYERFMLAPSKGSFFHNRIKQSYKFIKV